MLNIYKLKSNILSNNSLINKGLWNNDIKHHPTSTKEWFNSVYNYYKKNENNIPHLDIIVYKVIKNYFNMYSSSLEWSMYLGKISLKKRFNSLNNILISKPEFKHTNDKVKITLYVFNREQSFLNVRAGNLSKKIFAQYFFKLFTTRYKSMRSIYIIKLLLKRIKTLRSMIITLNIRRKTLINKLKTNEYKGYLIAYSAIRKCTELWSIVTLDYSKRVSILRYLRIVKDIKIRNEMKLGNKINKFYKKVHNKSKRESIIMKYKNIKNFIKSRKIVKFISRKLNLLNNNRIKNILNFYNEHINSIPMFSISRKVYKKKIKKRIRRLILLLRYNRAMAFNRFKFNSLLIPLKFFLEKIYKKDIEFDIIILKNYRLNSNILTQMIAIKLRNRKNRIRWLFSKVLRQMTSPGYIEDEYLKLSSINRKKNLQNTMLKHNINKNLIYIKPFIKMNVYQEKKARNMYINKLSYIKYEIDKLDSVLRYMYPSQKSTISSNYIKYINLYNIKQLSSKVLIDRNLENIVLDSMKNKNLSGIRLQGSGRLTKRAIAARSASCIMQKGIMKNIDSSYRESSSLLLKNTLSSNVDFTKVNGKTHVGSFGLKGWVNSI